MTFRAAFEHRDDLLRAALDEFCERGYDAASINRILSASGMSKGQLYHHFASKEGLYLALVEWMIDEKAAWFARQPATAAGDFVDVLGAQLRASLEFAAAHPDVDRLSRALLRERGRPVFDRVVRRFAFDPASALGELVAHHHGQERLRSDLSPRLDELLAFLRAGLGTPGAERGEGRKPVSPSSRKSGKRS